MTATTRHIRRLLRSAAPAAALLDELERRERLLALIREQLPSDLSARCVQASLTAKELTLFVESPVWVDRLRFLAPQLVDALGRTGLRIERCHVRVQPHADAAGPPAARAPRHPSSPAAAAAVRQAGAALGPGPLSSALQRLAATLDNEDGAHAGAVSEPEPGSINLP